MPDTGYAPNITDGYCTLACCKPKIRGTARLGDWVIGTMPKRFGADRLSYVMRVNEALAFDEYFSDGRFVSKKPDDNHPHGDNMYYRTEGKFIQLESSHHTKESLENDTQVDRMLIGSLFWYFGDSGPRIPSKLVPELIESGPGHKRMKDRDTIRDFVSWVSSEYRPGVLGRPRDGLSDSGHRKPTCSDRD
jgi:putative DNA base modification enzyme with NMAD domain